MDILEISSRAKTSFDLEENEACIQWSFAAIFSVAGLTWPYFYLGESYWRLEKKELGRSFHSLYLLRYKNGENATWHKISASRLEISPSGS